MDDDDCITARPSGVLKVQPKKESFADEVTQMVLLCDEEASSIAAII
jgi:hypothetical protein